MRVRAPFAVVDTKTIPNMHKWVRRLFICPLLGKRYSMLESMCVFVEEGFLRPPKRRPRR